MRWKVQDALSGCAVDTEDCTSYFDPSAHLPVQVHSPLSVSCSALQKPDFYALHLVGSLAHGSVWVPAMGNMGRISKWREGRQSLFCTPCPHYTAGGDFAPSTAHVKLSLLPGFSSPWVLRNTVSSPCSLRIMSVNSFLLFPTPGYLSIHYNH